MILFIFFYFRLNDLTNSMLLEPQYVNRQPQQHSDSLNKSTVTQQVTTPTYGSYLVPCNFLLRSSYVSFFFTLI